VSTSTILVHLCNLVTFWVFVQLKNFLTQNSKKKTFTDGEARYENLMASAKTLNDISVELKEKVEKLLSQAFKITNRASKLQLFRNNLAILKDRRRNEIVGSHDIVVARETVLIDSFSRLGGLDGKFWREFFSIKFEGRSISLFPRVFNVNSILCTSCLSS